MEATLANRNVFKIVSLCKLSDDACMHETSSLNIRIDKGDEKLCCYFHSDSFPVS
jgi:nitrite reductase/ring-hydroxylating ferredoxin subunit